MTKVQVVTILERGAQIIRRAGKDPGEPFGRVSRSLLVALCFAVCGAVPLQGQPLGNSPVGFTIARAYRMNQQVRLPGTVQSRLVSTVASEIAGLVVDFPVREGQRVQVGEVLARLRRENLELRFQEARAQVREDETRLELAERTLARTRELLGKGAVSQQDLDSRESEFEALARRIERLRIVIEQWEEDLERTTIRAPFAGVVVRESTQLGEWIDVGGPIIELMSLDDLEVAIDLPERYYQLIKLGSRARVTFDALPGVQVTGTTSAIIPRADPQARTFPVRLRIPTLGGRVGVGMLAAVEISSGRPLERTIIPKDAIIVQGRDHYAYVVDEQETVRKTEVVTGLAVGAWIEVGDSVQPGQRVVTRGNERLRDGQGVRTDPVEVSYKLP